MELRGYSKGLLNVYEMFTAEVFFGTIHTTETFYVTSGDPLPRPVVLRGLQILSDIKKEQSRHQLARGQHTPQQYQKLFPQLFKEGLGHAHKVKTRPSVTPVQQKFRRLPLTIQDQVFYK